MLVNAAGGANHDRCAHVYRAPSFWRVSRAPRSVSEANDPMQTRDGPGALFRSRDPGAPHDLAPAHDLRLDETLQALERRIFERQHAKPGDLAVDLRQGKNCNQLGVQLLDDVAWGLGGRDQHVASWATRRTRAGRLRRSEA